MDVEVENIKVTIKLKISLTRREINKPQLNPIAQ